MINSILTITIAIVITITTTIISRTAPSIWGFDYNFTQL